MGEVAFIIGSVNLPPQDYAIYRSIPLQIFLASRYPSVKIMTVNGFTYLKGPLSDLRQVAAYGCCLAKHVVDGVECWKILPRKGVSQMKLSAPVSEEFLFETRKLLLFPNRASVGCCVSKHVVASVEAAIGSLSSDSISLLLKLYSEE